MKPVKNKGYFSGFEVRAIILIFLIFAGATYAIVIMKEKKEIPVTAKEMSAVPASENETYTGDGFSISYPSEFSPRKEKGQIIFEHSVSFRHPDFCNLKEESFLDNFTDFSLTITSASGTITDLMNAEKLITNEADLEGEKIREVRTAGLSGYMVEIGVEGCGLDMYYFDLNNGKTLIAKRPLIPEYSEINGNRKTFLELPGTISPESGEKIFNGIISGIIPSK